MWQGKKILSTDWIRESVKVRFSPNDGYGYLWWIPTIRGDRGGVIAYMAAGGGGQRIYIFPHLNMVVAITAGYYAGGENGAPIINKLLKNYIIP